MKKSEAEAVLRQLIDTWHSNHCPPQEKDDPNYSAFKNWAFSEGYGHYFKFNSRCDADYDIELWFDRQLGQSWRN